MKKIVSSLALAAGLALFPPVASAEDGDNGAAWLSGCWQSASGATREIWTQSYDGLMFGHSVSYRDGRLVMFEDLRIEPRGEGLVYVASPGGAVPTAFTLTAAAPGSLVFDNPDHDYPQRLHYQQQAEGLVVTISLIDGSKPNDFTFTRCPA